MITLKPIPGFDGYKAGSDGHVYSFWSKGGCRLRSGARLREDASSPGGLRVRPRISRMKYRMIPVHRLVLFAFVGPPPSKAHVCAHWDGDYKNNKPENLRWATRKENEEDKKRHGTHQTGEGNPAAKLTEADVRKIRNLKGVKKKPEIQKMFGISSTTIKRIWNRRNWSHVD